MLLKTQFRDKFNCFELLHILKWKSTKNQMSMILLCVCVCLQSRFNTQHFGERYDKLINFIKNWVKRIKAYKKVQWAKQIDKIVLNFELRLLDFTYKYLVLSSWVFQESHILRANLTNLLIIINLPMTNYTLAVIFVILYLYTWIWYSKIQFWVIFALNQVVWQLIDLSLHWWLDKWQAWALLTSFIVQNVLQSLERVKELRCLCNSRFVWVL